MGITTNLAYDLFKIQNLKIVDCLQLHTLIIDFFAASFAGFAQNRGFNASVESIVLSQGGTEESSVFLKKQKYPVRIAAFMNAIYGHGAELDDGNKKAAGHAGVHIIPAVFSLAEKIGSSNDDVLLALATGYEAYIRISSAAQPGLVKRGFHSTGVAGTLACAAACSRLYHLSIQGIEDAIALSTTMTGGLLSYGDSRPAIKPLNPGKAAENGVFAVMLANNGVQGPTESLEGPNGWFHAVTDEMDEKYLHGTGNLLLHECYIKMYPACRHTHCGIDAALELHGQCSVKEIEKINVYIYPNAIKLAGIKVPKDKDESKFSIYYTLSCALLNGKYGISDMDPKNLSDDLLEIINKINLIADETLENRSRGIRGTRIIIFLKNGKVLEKTVLVPRGDPENPLSQEDVINKLKFCSQGIVETVTLNRLVKEIKRINGNEIFNNPMRILLKGNV